MQRYNVFLLVHKGLRAMMYDTSISLQHTDFGQMNYYPQSLEKLAVTLDTFDAHAGHEDNFIFCLLDPCAKQLMGEMEAEHNTDHALTDELRVLMHAYKDAPGADVRQELGTRLCNSFHEFIAFNLLHLNKEETTVNEVLWQHYTDLDIIQANQRLVSSLAPEEARGIATWMMRSCSNTELINWIKGMKDSIPEAMMQMLMLLAEQELPAHRFDAIQDGVLEIAHGL